MKYFHSARSAFAGLVQKHYPHFQSTAMIAALGFGLACGLIFTACAQNSAETSVPAPATEVTYCTEATIPAATVSPPPVTQPVRETTEPPVIPEETETPSTEPEATQAPTEFSMESSPAYKKLLTLPNAEDFLCDEFGQNVLAIYAEWIDANTELLESYSERWYMKKFAEGGAGFFCHTPLEEDNSCDYLVLYMHIGNLYSEPMTGRRYFTDIPREEISALIYGAYDPIGVDDNIKDRFIEEALNSEYFAWNVLDPEFRYECYYEVVTICPYPEWEPENTFDRIQLTFHVWRPGMAEDEYYEYALTYRTDTRQVGFAGNSGESLISGMISN